MMEKLNTVLEQFKTGATCIKERRHRHFVSWDLRLAPGKTVAKVERCTKELGLALSLPSAPIVEVISSEGIVRLHATRGNAAVIPASETMKKSTGKGFAIGESSDGSVVEPVFPDHPHTLIAGTTGSGKSSLMHTILANIAAKVGAGERHLVYLVDPKQVEFAAYKPGQTIRRISRTFAEALETLALVEGIMESRYSELRARNCVSSAELPTMIPIYVFIDEISDLVGRGKEFTERLERIAQKSRAAGIYFVLATQHPDRKVLGSGIQANFQARIVCRVADATSSRVVLGRSGAQHLAGKGDALLKSGLLEGYRFQASFIEPRAASAAFTRAERRAG